MTFPLQDYEDRLAPWSDMRGHMPFLRETVAAYREPAVIELGTRTGNSTAAFLAGIRENGGELWSVDMDDPAVPAYWHDLDCWHFLKADDASDAAQAWLPQQCDILFVDSDHSRDHVLEVLRLHVPRVKPGGIVLLHDTEWRAPGQMLDAPEGTVTEAVNAYCGETGRTWENRTGSYGLGIIRP